jgi:ankyrin repeat protein
LAFETGNPKRAELVLHSILDNRPQASPPDYAFPEELLNMQLGDALKLQQHYEEAIAAYRKASKGIHDFKSCKTLAQFNVAETLLLYEGDLSAMEIIDRDLNQSEDHRVEILKGLAPYVKFLEVGTLSGSYFAPDEAALELAKYPIGGKVIARLLQAHLLRNVDVLDGQGNTLLVLAAQADMPDVARVLIHAGAKVDRANQNGDRALGYFCAVGSEAGVRMLLEAHADAHYKDRNDITPLHAAIGSGNVAVVKLIFPKARPIARADLNWLLTQSAYFGMTEVVKELVHQGAEINQPEQQVMPPIIAAILSRHTDLVAWLLDQRADPGVSYMGSSANDFARDSGDPEMIRLITERGKKSI